MAHKYKPAELLPSERELALRFGAERGTVRKALEMLVDSGLVEKRAGVGTRVIGSGEKPFDGPAKGRVLGFIMADDASASRRLTQPYYADLFYHLEDACKENDCQLIYSSAAQESDLSSFLSSHDFLSVVFVTHIPDAYIKQAQDRGIPTILVNEQHPGKFSISYDSADGAYQAMRYLIEAGHRRIAIITGPSHFYTSDEKMSGCYKAAAEFGIPLSPENIAAGNWEYQGGYSCIHQLFEKRGKAERPTAVFAFNDMMCIGAVNALREMGYRIPEDVSVVGFDNMEQLQFCEPDLTTVDANTSAMARLIVECAMSSMLTKNELGIKLLVPARLVVRDTVAAPAG